MKNYGDLETMINRTEQEAKILTIDIETSPIVAYTWGPMWEANLIKVIKEGNIMCYSAKWLNGNQVTKGLIDYKGYKKGIVNDSKIIKDIHRLLDEADIVVTQNGVAFDSKYITTRFIANGLQPPSPYKNVDTALAARRLLKLPSNALDNIGKYFGLGEKMEHEGFALWEKCMAGDIKAWRKMKEYNEQDVKLTEKVYLKLRPFMKTHPNVTAYQGVIPTKEKLPTGDCPKCGSDHTQGRGYATNSTTTYARAQCQDCGGWYHYGKPVKRLFKPGINA